MMNATSVVITAPHAVCVEGRRTADHPCDSITASYANLLHRELQKRGLSSTLLLADRERRICDLNRRVCRHTPYRTRLRSLLKPGVFVLDAHSFPESAHPRELYGYFLDDNVPPATYTQDLMRYMNQRLPWSFPLVRGGGNDIQVEARERGAAAVLLELNEQRLANVRLQQQVVTVLADWIQRQMRPAVSACTTIVF